LVAPTGTADRSPALAGSLTSVTMRKIVEALGFVLLVVGVSGTIDHLAVQPFFGFLNVLNRVVFPRVVPGYELYANLTVAVLGLAVLLAASRGRSS
jgi:hypothetical protein